MVVRVGDIEVICAEREPLGRVEPGGCAWAIVAGEALGSGSGYGDDVSCCVYLTDDVVAGFGYIEISLGIVRNRRGEDEGDSDSARLRVGKAG